ncbi:MAG: hypothetical protein JWQ20_3451 [Conexibacter sp.]|nr:hypothetical protein [Conexibacter sp.]
MTGDIDTAVVEALSDRAVAVLARRLAPLLEVGQPSADWPPGPTRGYMPPKEAADYLGVTRKRIYDLKSSRILTPDGYDGRTPLFTAQTLDEYVRRCPMVAPRLRKSGTEPRNCRPPVA